MKRPPARIVIEAFVVPPALYVTLFGAFWFSNPSAYATWRWTLWTLVILLIGSYMIEFLLAAPLYLFLRFKGWVNWITTTLGGAASLVVWATAAAWANESETHVPASASIGAICGFIFWLYLKLRLKFYLNAQRRKNLATHASGSR